MKLITSDGKEYKGISKVLPVRQESGSWKTPDGWKLKFIDKNDEFMFIEDMSNIVAIKMEIDTTHPICTEKEW